MLIAADLVLASNDHWMTVLLGVALWGVHMGITQGLLARMVADATPDRSARHGIRIFQFDERAGDAGCQRIGRVVMGSPWRGLYLLCGCGFLCGCRHCFGLAANRGAALRESFDAHPRGSACQLIRLGKCEISGKIRRVLCRSLKQSALPIEPNSFHVAVAR